MRGAPAQWLVADRELHERLVAAGLRPERTAVVMGAELEGLALDDPPAGLAIEPVRELDEWIAVAGQCVFPAAEREQRGAILASLRLGAEAPLQLRIARRDGRAIGVASFFVDGEIALGQHLGVLAVERRAGVGRALAQACARDARAAGASFAVLGPTPETIAFYRLLGAVLCPGLRDRSFYLS
jgi:GNAT superfamily N-acetyltransferase